jgi:hypothetical protein
MADSFALFDTPDRFYPGSRKVRGSLRGSAPAPTAWDEKPLIKRLNGRDVEMYTVGALARAMNKSVYSVRSYEANGYIPKTPYRLPSRMVNGYSRPGRRLYTREMITAVVNVLAANGLLEARRIEWRDFPTLSQQIAEEWRSIQARQSTTPPPS